MIPARVALREQNKLHNRQSVGQGDGGRPVDPTVMLPGDAM